ncbi:MAG: hypothetical protein AMXMBFR64_55440 [Myxococcales bacterium]
MFESLARFHGLDADGLLTGIVAPADDSRGATVFLLHGPCQDFAAADLDVLSSALNAGRALTAAERAWGDGAALRRRLGFSVCNPAGPRSADAARQGYQLAQHVRRELGLAGRPQGDMRALLEDTLGIAVQVHPFVTRGLRAASIIDDRRAGAAAVLGADDPERRGNPSLARVHLAHELCHVLFDPGARGTVRIALDTADAERPGFGGAASANVLLESRAKGFAAEFLLPCSGLVELLGPPIRTESLTTALGLVDRARRWFGTPWEIATWHLKNLGFVAPELVTGLLDAPPGTAVRTPTKLPSRGGAPLRWSSIMRSRRLRPGAAVGIGLDEEAASRAVLEARAAVEDAQAERRRLTLAALADDVAAGRLLEATDRLVESIDALFRDGELDVVAALLEQLEPHSLPPTVIGGVLMVTAHAREGLGRSRAAFVDRALAALREPWGLDPAAVSRIEARYR